MNAEVDPMDTPPTPEELTEAEALERALRRDHAAPGLDEDALEAAHLLTYSAPGGDQLAPERLDAIFTEAMEGARRRPAPEPEASGLGVWLRSRWALFSVGLVAAAALLFVVIRPAPESTGGPSATLPAPNRGLLTAQLEAAGEGDRAALDEAMAPYRAELVAALEARYTR